MQPFSEATASERRQVKKHALARALTMQAQILKECSDTQDREARLRIALRNRNVSEIAALRAESLAAEARIGELQSAFAFASSELEVLRNERLRASGARREG